MSSDNIRITAMKVAGIATATTLSVFIAPAPAQAPAVSATAPAATPALKSPWGEPDLQRIWTDEADTPLQRRAKYANQEFFTEAQRPELDRARAALITEDKRSKRGTETDVTGAYSAVFLTVKHIGARASLIVAPGERCLPGGLPEFGTAFGGSFRRIVQTPAASRCSTTWARARAGSATSS